ncbi:MAG: hypothetical protein HY885_11155 [Deltaproteobacteria bacterium]|nr:hypothetical protein [Deltaproteobacteria bacterium]
MLQRYFSALKHILTGKRRAAQNNSKTRGSSKMTSSVIPNAAMNLYYLDFIRFIPSVEMTGGTLPLILQEVQQGGISGSR